MPYLGDLVSHYFSAFATLSMWFLIASTIAYNLRSYLVAALGVLAVGFGGCAVVWSRWSDRAGDLNGFGAFLHPTGLAFGEALLLVTHAPLVPIGIAILWFHFAGHRG
jgi:hypothetical protein